MSQRTMRGAMIGAAVVGVLAGTPALAVGEQIDLLQKMYASDIQAFDLFGSDVDIDGSFAVVGAPRQDAAGSNSGAAYVFEYDGQSWVQRAKLTPSDGAPSNQFGTAVAISNGFVVVGAPYGDHGASNSGAAYVFVKPETGWVDATEHAKLVAKDAESGDLFGTSVDIDGLIAVVGAPQSLSNGRGKVYVFRKPFSGWADTFQTARVGYSGAKSGDSTGHAVAVEGQYIVAGAPGIDAAASNGGAALLFIKPNDGWTDSYESAILTASNAFVGDGFGTSVDMDGETIVVGSPFSDNFYPDSGGTYVFSKPEGEWESATETARLTSSAPALLDEMGISVAVDQDMVLAGSHKDDPIANNAGAAYAYVKPRSGWENATEDYYVIANIPGASDGLGSSVALDNYQAMIGAPYDDDRSKDAGVVYNEDLTPPCITIEVQNLVAGEDALITARNGEPGESFVVVYGLGGLPQTFVNVNGYCATFDFNFITNRNIMGLGTFDAGGNGVVTAPIRADIVGFTLKIQAAMRGTCPDECMSNVVRRIVL